MRVTPIAVALALALVGVPALSQPASGVRYVDYDHGDDARDGRTPATAWRHAPGDPRALGQPALKRLGPGDQLVFAAGVRYRGAIVLNGSGSPEAPVVLTSAEGAAPAIIDGSEAAAAVRSCRDAADCGGAALWSKLSRIEFAEPAPVGAALFTREGPLVAAQFPNMPDAFYSDEVAHLLPVPGKDLAEGRARLPKAIAESLAAPGERQIAVWTKGNQVRLREVTGLDGEVALFDPTGLSFYTDRPDRIAVVGHPALVDAVGEYAFIEGRRAAIAMLPAGVREVSISSGRVGIDLKSNSNITIRGLSFENMTGVSGNVRTGVPIGNFTAQGAGIRIEANRFRNLWMANGQGALTLRGIHGLVITGNRIENVALGSGIRVQRSSDAVLSGNDIRRIGRTGIMLMDVVGAEVSGNRVSDVKGVHGNGMSVYLDNQNIRVSGNVIFDSTRPATFHGGKNGVENSLSFVCNVFIGSRDSDAALTSWSNDQPIRKLSIERNVLVGGKVGARLSAADAGVTVTGNRTNGVAIRGGATPDWAVSDNVQIGGKASGPRTSFEDVLALRRPECAATPSLSTPAA